MSQQEKQFHYTYSAARHEEIQAIRRKYEAEPVQADKMQQLRKLDAAVTNKALRVAVCVGVVFALVMGFGMSLVMTDLGAQLGMTSVAVPGILIGAVGMAGVIAAYPVYQLVLKKERAKAAPEILKLAEELVQEKN